MVPTIWPDDMLVVEPSDSHSVGVGDILVWLDGTRLIAHRVIRVFERAGQRMFQTQGDAHADADPVTPAVQILGRVRAVERPEPVSAGIQEP
jgi:hypothetical protein